MKKFKLNFILVFVLTSLIFACSGDDSDDVGDANNASGLIGTWRLIQEVDYIDGVQDFIYDVPEGCNEEILSFSTNEISYKNDDDCDGTFDNTDTYTYSISGNQILVDDDTAEIVELNQTLLIIRNYISTNEYYDFIYEKL